MTKPFNPPSINGTELAAETIPRQHAVEEEEQKSLAPIGCVSYPWATFHGVHEFVILRNSLEKVSEREMMLCEQMLKPRGNNGRSG